MSHEPGPDPARLKTHAGALTSISGAAVRERRISGTGWPLEGSA